MAEPVPDSVQNPDKPTSQASTGATDDAAPETTLPRNAEDRAAAAALSSLNADATTIENGDAGGTGGGAAGAAKAKGAPSAADREALGAAMSRLEAEQKRKKQGTKEKEKMDAAAATAAAGAAGGKAKTGEVEEAAKKKVPAVKVGAEDVNLLVDQLDLTKVKATDLLKAHEGDPVRAIRAFITPAAV